MKGKLIGGVIILIIIVAFILPDPTGSGSWLANVFHSMWQFIQAVAGA